MQKIEKVRSFREPKQVVIGHSTVDVASNVVFVEKTEKAEAHFEYDLERYSKDEYIAKLAENSGKTVESAPQGMTEEERNELAKAKAAAEDAKARADAALDAFAELNKLVSAVSA